MPSVALVWLVVCFIWGSTWIVIKIGLNDLPPIGFAAVRFALAIVVLYGVLRAMRIPWPKSSREWRLIAITGVLQFSVTYSLIFWGEQYISSGLTAVLQANISVFSLVLARFYLPNERITLLKILAVCAGVVGVAVIFYDQLRVQNALAFWGSVGIVVSAYTASQSSILIKANGSSLHPGMLLFGQMLCGLPPLAIYSALVEGNPLRFNWTWQATASVAYLAVFGTIAAFWLFYWMLHKVESTIAMMISVVTPLIAVVAGWLVLDERLPVQTAIGGLLIMVGVTLVVYGARTGASR